jgi:hypothetical protein
MDVYFGGKVAGRRRNIGGISSQERYLSLRKTKNNMLILIQLNEL